MHHWNAINTRKSNDSTQTTRKEVLPHSSGNNNSNDGHHKGAMSGRTGAITNAKQQVIRYMFRKTTTKKEVQVPAQVPSKREC